MSVRTAKVFDLMFKSIIKEASPQAVVHLINGIFKKNYPFDTQVKVEPTEFVKEHPKSGKLEKIISDIVITLADKDTYLIEAQINDDIEMIVRIFNYSIFAAFENKIVSDDGSYMEINMPSPAVIYWENSKAKDIAQIKIKFPNNREVLYKIPAFKVLQHSVSELENMALLLPFYILKIRSELNKKSTNSEKRQALSEELESYVLEIDKTLNNCKRNNYLTKVDVARLLHKLSMLNGELYGKYKEFSEVDVTLKKLMESGIDEAIAKAEKKGMERGLSQGMKRGISQGMERGLNQGMKRGISQGIERGISQGMSQAAKSMLKDGLSPARVARITRLPKEEVLALR